MRVRILTLSFLLSVSFLTVSPITTVEAGPLKWLIGKIWSKKRSRTAPQLKSTKVITRYRGPSLIKMTAATTLSSVLFDLGIKELKNFPIKNEFEVAMQNKRDYQVRVCRNSDGDIVALPRDFINCPFGDYSITDGPLLQYAKS